MLGGGLMGLWTSEARRKHSLKQSLKKKLSKTHPPRPERPQEPPRVPRVPRDDDVVAAAAKSSHPPLAKQQPQQGRTLADFERALDGVDSLAPSSRQLYKERMRSIAKATDKTDDFEWCLAHPDETWAALKKVRIAKNGNKPLSDQTMRASASLTPRMERLSASHASASSM